MFTDKGKLLRIFVSEADKREGVPLYEWIVVKARENGLAGATVLRGMGGFGSHSQMHKARILRISQELPVVVEIVDTADKIEGFIPLLDDAMKEGLITVENVQIRLYGRE